MKKIKLNSNIYSDTAIKTAINAYKNYAFISVRHSKKYATVTFWKCKFDEVQTIKEFENYLIGAENS